LAGSLRWFEQHCAQRAQLSQNSLRVLSPLVRFVKHITAPLMGSSYAKIKDHQIPLMYQSHCISQLCVHW